MRTNVITTLKRQATKLLAGLRELKEPIFITWHGQASAYLLDVDDYELMVNRMKTIQVFRLLMIAIFCLFSPSLSYAEGLSLQNLSVRLHGTEKTILGNDAQEDFSEYAVSANFELPWKHDYTPGWAIGTRLMASTGILRGASKNALVVSLIPELILENKDGRFTLDLGAGGALFSRHRFGTQDYGGPFQFALTLGVGVPLYQAFGLGYRYVHYSDAAIHGPDTTGADLHMLEFIYRF